MIKEEDELLGEEVKLKEQELEQFWNDNKNVYDHAKMVRSRVEELENELAEA